jgi:hypothetical protein
MPSASKLSSQELYRRYRANVLKVLIPHSKWKIGGLGYVFIHFLHDVPTLTNLTQAARTHAKYSDYQTPRKPVDPTLTPGVLLVNLFPCYAHYSVTDILSLIVLSSF